MPHTPYKVVAIIPVRQKDLAPQGELLALRGKPLLAYTVEAAQAAHRIDRIIVSTDGAETAELARRLGAEAPFLRPAELAGPQVPLARVLQHALEWLEKEESYRADVVVLLEVSHPIRPAGLIDKVIETLLSSDLDSVFTAYEEHHAFWTIDDYGELRPVLEGHAVTRAERRPLFRELTGLVCASRAEVVRGGQKLGQRVGLVPVRGWIGLIDTQDEAGLMLADRLLAHGEGHAKSVETH
jgi:CMP-N-acetylneuraminic acid synthetase